MEEEIQKPAWGKCYKNKEPSFSIVGILGKFDKPTKTKIFGRRGRFKTVIILKGINKA